VHFLTVVLCKFTLFKPVALLYEASPRTRRLLLTRFVVLCGETRNIPPYELKVLGQFYRPIGGQASAVGPLCVCMCVFGR